MDRSVWSEFTDKPAFGSLEGDLDTDVLVVGGGIAGVLTAYFLKASGRDVVLAEAKTIGSGITKNTTAVLTAQHDVLYGELIENRGKEAAKSYLDANLDAVEEFRKLSRTVDCDFTDKPSYYYSLDRDLSNEIDALASLGYRAKLTNETGLPFEVESAVEFPDMAEFHPLKFLYGVAKDLPIYENTFVDDLRDHSADTGRHKIRYKQAVVATHFPFLDRAGWFFAKMHQARSYVVALENAGDVRGTYTDDTEDGFYFRNYKDLLLVGKGDHRTGTKTEAFEELDRFIASYYPNAKVRYRWANQDCVTLDATPYIGRYGRLENVYTLTGFNLWGMTNAMAGAKILTDLLNGTENPQGAAFAPNRSALRKELFENLGAATANLLYPTVRRCPHLGCALKYNKREHSWDCPCHGSRFEADGKLIDNPATKDANI